VWAIDIGVPLLDDELSGLFQLRDKIFEAVGYKGDFGFGFGFMDLCLRFPSYDQVTIMSEKVKNLIILAGFRVGKVDEEGCAYISIYQEER